jgi:NADH/NAD ratio-sensing transcriptional regulator Rex
MPKNSSTAVLRRWQALDRHLRDGNLLVRYFAEQWGVSEKTIRRDLDAFRQLGQRTMKGYEQEIAEWWWRYERGVEPLFTSNLR